MVAYADFTGAGLAHVQGNQFQLLRAAVLLDLD
jgi:hypothetical protein